MVSITSFRFTEDEGDIWPVQAAQRAEAFPHTPGFEQPIVSVAGRKQTS